MARRRRSRSPAERSPEGGAPAGARRVAASPEERAGAPERSPQNDTGNEQQGGSGLYGSDVEGNIPRASIAELIGTFILVSRASP